MLIKYLLSKKYREDYSRNFAIRINEADEQIEKIYFNIATKSKENNSPKTKKAS